MADNLAKASAVPVDLGDLARTYLVEREIGRGGMARVFEARHRTNGLHVAIKVASPDRADAPLLARLMHEGRLMSRLQHPNIVRLHDVRPIRGGCVAMVMEYVQGMSLAEMLRSSAALPPATCVAILEDIGRALAHAHGNGIVHLDVKPANVLVDIRTGVAKLSDFGIARVAGEAMDPSATGTVIGTPAYMSPEQIDGLALDGRSDIYALGLLGWQLVSGEVPWAGEPLHRLLYKQKHEALRPVRDFRRDLPPRLPLAIEGALEKDPAHRWQRVEDLLAQLQADVPTAANRARHALQLTAPSPVELVDQTTMPIYRRPRERAEPASPAVAAMADTAESAASAPEAAPAVAPLAAPPVVVAPQPAPAPRTGWRRREFAVGVAVGALAAALVATRQPAISTEAPSERRTSTVAAAGLVALPPVEVRHVPLVMPTPVDSAAVIEPPSSDTLPTTSVRRNAKTADTRTRAVTPRRPRAARPSAPPGATGSLAARARALLLAGDATRAARLVDSALKLNPRDGDAYLVRARLRQARGSLREARSDLELAARMGRQWEALSMSTVLTARSSGRAAARARLQGAVRSALSPRRTLGPDHAVGLAGALVAVGDRATALTLLERAEKNGRLRALLADPLLNPVRSSPRFRRLERGSS